MKRRSTAWCKSAWLSRKQYLLKSIYFNFKTPTKKILIFFEQNWERVEFGKNLLQRVSQTLTGIKLFFADIYQTFKSP